MAEATTAGVENCSTVSITPWVAAASAPFTLTDPVKRKLDFVHQVVHDVASQRTA